MKYLIPALALALVVSACGKYEEGPDFSLRSKKGRLAGSWELKKVDGKEPDEQATWEFKKDGDLIMDAEVWFMDTTFFWTFYLDWEFSPDKEDLVLSDPNGGDVVDYSILQLSNKELKLLDKSANSEAYFEKD